MRRRGSALEDRDEIVSTENDAERRSGYEELEDRAERC
jgi:hypothetical protein